MHACRLIYDAAMQHAAFSTHPLASHLADVLPEGVPAPAGVCRAEPCAAIDDLDELVPTLDGRPRKEVLLAAGTAFQPTGGKFDGPQHDPGSASSAAGDSGTANLRECSRMLRLRRVPEQPTTEHSGHATKPPPPNPLLACRSAPKHPRAGAPRG